MRMCAARCLLWPFCVRNRPTATAIANTGITIAHAPVPVAATFVSTAALTHITAVHNAHPTPTVSSGHSRLHFAHVGLNPTRLPAYLLGPYVRPLASSTLNKGDPKRYRPVISDAALKQAAVEFSDPGRAHAVGGEVTAFLRVFTPPTRSGTADNTYSLKQDSALVGGRGLALALRTNRPTREIKET